MKLITGPTVYLVGRQEVVGHELLRFLEDHDADHWESDSSVGAEVLAEVGGRLCYLSFAKPRPGGNAAYLGHIKEVGHGSVLEHAVFSLLVTGVSRSLTHELVRHRAGVSPSQLSQRYVDESVAEYVVPRDLQPEVEAAEAFRAWTEGYMDTSHEGPLEAAAAFHKNHPHLTEAMVAAGNDWLAAVETAHERYVRLSDYLAAKASTPIPCWECSGEGGHTRVMETTGGTAWSLCRTCGGKQNIPPHADKTAQRKFSRQAARSVLPNATETKIFLTANARALRHFLEQRGSRHAEPEIRVLAGKVLDVVQKAAPNLFSDYRRTLLPDGTFELDTDYRKV